MSWVVGLIAAAVIAQGFPIVVPVVVRFAGGFVVGGAMFLIFLFPKPDNRPFGGGDWWP